MSKRFFCRAMCLLTAAVLTLPLLVPAALAAQTGDTVMIRTVSDLLELAKSCTLDTWSQGKTVRLEVDLDLTSSGFTAIPTFDGTFLGNNHTISGLSITNDGSRQGLFRYLQPSGQVTNLTVRGTVAPGGSAGQVGGIVGVNETTGRVTGCVSFAVVSGKLRTGGVAGKNAGILLSCTNIGPVGYAHVGYNVGSVAGRQSGFLPDCSNSGHILGRKDVGGVVGQSEPDVLISDSSVLSDIRAASDQLSVLVDQAIGHTDQSTAGISARLSAIGSYADSVRNDA